MPFQQTHLDAITTAVDDLTAIKAQYEAAKTRLNASLEALAPGMDEGDIRCLGGRVTAVTKSGGVVKYVVIPGLLDPERETPSHS